MWMIVGLGNPGNKYLLTRHNVGFMALDYFVKAMGAEQSKPKTESKAFVTTFSVDGQQMILVKPQTYMNLSGESVGEIMRYYKIEIPNIVVAHDDLDQPFGNVRIKAASGDGGHNGLKSLIEHLGTNEFPRVKIGIGRPPHPEMEIADYVVQNFSKTEQAGLPDILNTSVDAIESVIFEGLITAMNKFNGNKK